MLYPGPNKIKNRPKFHQGDFFINPAATYLVLLYADLSHPPDGSSTAGGPYGSLCLQYHFIFDGFFVPYGTSIGAILNQ